MPETTINAQQSDSHDLESSTQRLKTSLMDLDADKIDSPTLARLVAEVRNESVDTQSYNRTYNRHNR